MIRWLRRRSLGVSYCQVDRLMRRKGLTGLRGNLERTTVCDDRQQPATDLVSATSLLRCRIRSGRPTSRVDLVRLGLYRLRGQRVPRQIQGPGGRLVDDRAAGRDGPRHGRLPTPATRSPASAESNNGILPSTDTVGESYDVAL